MEDAMEIAQIIRNGRIAAGLKQKDLAEKLGVYPKDVWRWETGVREPKIQTFIEICRICNISVDKAFNL